MKTTIYVKLLSENIEVYRPVVAKHLVDNIFKIIEHNNEIKDQYGEVWEYNYNDIVVCDYDDKALEKIDTSRPQRDECINDMKETSREDMFIENKEDVTILKLSNVIQWSGLKTVEEIEQTILPIVKNREEYKKYKTLFENLSESVNDDILGDTMLPSELVSSILDTLGMVVFYRADSNTLSTISYERDDNALIFWHQWSEYIRENGFESVQGYSYEDERILKTSDALMRYGYETIEKLYERTNVSL